MTSDNANSTRVYIPDETLLRRFGIVRAVGGGAYIIAVVILGVVYGLQTWPLLLGIPVLAVVTTLYFMRSQAYPRTSVALSLVADTLVLGGAAAFVGGTGAGTASLYVIPIVSAGIILGPAAAASFTTLSVSLAWLQLGSEQMGFTPHNLYREDLTERVVVLMITTAVLISVGYLTGTYASRLQDNIAAADLQADEVRRRTRRRRSFVRQAAIDVRHPLQAVEAVAEQLDGDAELDDTTRRALASQLRMRTAQLEGEIGQLADVGALDEARETKPEAVLLGRVVSDCLSDLSAQLADFDVHVDVPAIRVAGDRRAARRITYNLLENIIEHTPPGTTVWIEGRQTGGQGVLVVTDDGPGVSAAMASRLFNPPDDHTASRGRGPVGRRVGLPLVKELVDAMGAEISYTPRVSGGSIFLVGFRLAPRDAPGAEDHMLNLDEGHHESASPT
ncbi:MAG: sensor histidine kinase [Euzebya sp.]